MYKWKCSPHLRQALASQRGVSLYEALVAVALIGVGAAMVSQLDQIIPDKKVSLNRSCDSHAQAVAVAVQEETYYREVMNFNPVLATNAGRTIPVPGFSATAQTSRALPNAALDWTPANPANNPNRFVITPANVNSFNGVVLHNAELIQGSMRTLSSIYNNTPAVRCAYGAYAPLTAALPLSNDLNTPGRNTTVQIMIRPYNMDGSLIGPAGPPWVAANCPAPLSIGPLGEYITNGLYNAYAPGSGYNVVAGTYYEDWLDPTAYGHLPGYWPTPPVDAGFGPTNTIATLGGAGQVMAQGFNLDVQITYQNNQNQTEQCNFTQKFEYPRDRKPPPPPNWNRVIPASNLTGPANAGICDPTVQTGMTVEIGYKQSADTAVPKREFERGTQFLCRDLSWKKGFAPVTGGPVTYNMPVCIRGGVVSTTDLVYGYYNGFDPALQDFSVRTTPNYWVPCDRLKQCGFLPTAVSFSQPAPNTAGDNLFYTLDYSPPGGMPQGCVMNWEVVAVDTAGNTSVAGQNVLNQPPLPSDNRRFLDTGQNGITPLDNQVNYSQCGGYFTPGPTSYGSFILNGGFFSCP